MDGWCAGEMPTEPSLVNNMLLAANMPTIQFGKDDWSSVFEMDPATRQEVKAILLDAAPAFDLYCSRYSKKYNGPDKASAGGPVSMHDIMSRYFEESSDW